MVRKLIEYLSEMNLLTQKDFKRYNELIKKGYEIIAKQSLDTLSGADIKIVNSFILAADDFGYVANIGKNETIEPKEFVEKIVAQNSIKVNGQEIILTPQQKEVLEILESSDKNRVIFSMPTSFGKSMLIRIFAIINQRKGRRTIVITPTISLMNEYQRIFKNGGIKVSSSAQNKTSDVFVLTQERALNFVFSKRDILIVDEAYELSEKNERTGIAYFSIYNAIKTDCEIYMFMPNIDNPKECLANEGLASKFIEHKEFRSLSSREILRVDQSRKKWLKKNFSELQGNKAIFDTKANFRHWYNYFDEYLEDVVFDENHSLIIEFLEREFGSQFTFIKKLKKGLVISNGDVPKIFRFFSEIFYKNKTVSWIVANNTITKGVNLKPDHVVIFTTDFINNHDINNFELRNAIGRSGRYDKNEIKSRMGMFI